MEPNYLEGRNRATARDYDAAIECFEKALQANPHSAAAHLELAVIYDQHKHDYAAAIYHYQRHLNLQPDSHAAEGVHEHIASCKIELAKGAPFGAISREMQRDVEKLSSANTSLRQQVESLTAQLAQHPLVVTQYVTNIGASYTPSPTPLAQVHAELSQPSIMRTNASRARVSDPVRAAPSPSVSQSLTYIVRPNDTVAAIARRYGLSPQSILSANRSLDPRRLRPGQVITIPKG